MVSNRNMVEAILQTKQINKNGLLEPIENWINTDSFQISINKIKNTTIVNGSLVYLITYKALTKYKNIIKKSSNRIYVPSTNKIYLIEDVGGFDGLWNLLSLKVLEG